MPNAAAALTPAERRSVARRYLKIHSTLLAAYGDPTWRNPLPALDELVSTILSQSTNDVNRDRAFEALRARYPTWAEVRDAPGEAVRDAIRVAGLANQKGPRIQDVLRAITAERGTLDLEFLRAWPPAEARAWLTKFKGVGPKTAAIVMLFSLGLPGFPVDTHVHRVTGRLGLRPEALSAENSHAYFEALLPAGTFYAAHLNIIRHGREVCHARKPACGQCVLLKLCPYGQAQLPVALK